METQVTISWTGVFSAAVFLFVSIIGFFVVRIIKGYDGQIKQLFTKTDDLDTIRDLIKDNREKITELFCRTKDLPAIREALDWIKKELN